MSQQLPANETFEAPDFLAPTSGGTHYCTPQFSWYFGYDPTFTINPSTHATCPWKGEVGAAIGQLYTNSRGSLYIPDPAQTNIPCRVHRIGPSATQQIDGHAAFLARAEDALNTNDLNYKVVFGIESRVSGGTFGLQSGGTGPGAIALPQPDSSTDENHRSLGQTFGGQWQAGGPATSVDPVEVNHTWAAFTGCSLFFRTGKGGQPVTYNDTTSGEDYTRGLNTYALGIYPEINSSANRVDLIAELWQFESATALASGTTPRLMLKQTIDGGAQNLLVDEPYHLRAEVETNGSSNVEITCYIGQYKLSGVRYSERQLFKDGQFANDTYSVGTSITHTASTGLVVDAHSNKITAHSERSFGWSCGIERLENIAPRLHPNTANPAPQNTEVVEGLHRLTVKRKSTGAVLYRDRFERSVLETFGNSATELVTGPWGVSGRNARGLFTFDIGGKVQGGSYSELGKLLLWGDSQTDTTPNDYVTIDYDQDDSGGSTQPGRVLRQFVHLRPSTQVYNHHRKVEFKPGADNPSGSASGSANEFEVAIQLRGSHTGITMNGVFLSLYWVTNFASSVTFARLRIENRTTDLNNQNPWFDGNAVASRTWSTSSELTQFNSDFPLYDGNFHSIALKVEAYAAAPDPSTAAVYEARIDGTPVQMTDTSAPYQSSGTTPFPVIENGPTHVIGTQEAFSWTGPFEFDNSGNRMYTLYQFRNWTEESVAADPGDSGNPDDQASIVIGGEGAAVGSLNLSTGALGISGSGVYDVEVDVELTTSYPRRRTAFESGHVYASPAVDKPRRTWAVRVRAATLAIMQSLQTFYNSHNGSETPFTFVVPITNDGYADSGLTNEEEQVVGMFVEDTLVVRKIGPNTYDIDFKVAERLVA